MKLFPANELMETQRLMNIIPVITLFGGLTAFFSLAFALRFALGKHQVANNQDDNQLAS